MSKVRYQDQDHLPPSITPSNTSPFSCSLHLISSSQDQGEQLESNDLSLVSGPTTHTCNKINTTEQPKIEHAHGSVKWMSSKMRLMRKMMGTDRILVNEPRIQTHRDQTPANKGGGSSNSPSGIIRVCSNCNTTKTPLWRSGPQGPKSLCNACGIRQMKARRAMKAAASGGLIPANMPKKVHQKKEKRSSEVDRTVPFKKRFKITASGAAQKYRFDDVAISLSKNLASFHQTLIPQEEKDAAILLMALSCGLIHG